jgi:hypothetical protein
VEAEAEKMRRKTAIPDVIPRNNLPIHQGKVIVDQTSLVARHESPGEGGDSHKGGQGRRNPADALQVP